jgi:hypothetical protein
MEKGATGVELLAPIRPQLSGFARVCHTLAVVSVFGCHLGHRIADRAPTSIPPSAADDADPVALPAADGMAALLLERLKQRLVRQGEASRHICVPSPDPEDEALAAVEKPLDQAERDAVGLEMARSAGALADVEQEAVRWALAISAVLLLAEGLVPRSLPIPVGMGADGFGQCRRGCPNPPDRVVCLAVLRDRARRQIEPRRGGIAEPGAYAAAVAARRRQARYRCDRADERALLAGVVAYDCAD